MTQLTDEEISEIHATAFPNTPHLWTRGIFDFARAIIAAHEAKQLEQQGKDAERLDWLEQQGTSYGFQDLHEGNRWCVEGPFGSLRRLIDCELAAIAAAEEGGTP